MTIWRVRIACWIPKATNTHSEHVIIIVFLLLQLLNERALMLRYTSTECLFETEQQCILCLTTTEFLYIMYMYTYSICTYQASRRVSYVRDC
jgi:hypothetical protein